jgi:hypothetical protein
MAGTIVADTIQDGSSNSTAMTNAIKGSAKAWVNFAGSTAAISGSFNVSMVTRNSTGNYTVTFPSGTFTNANYCAVFNNNNGARYTWFDTLTTTSINCYCFANSGSYSDVPSNCLAIISS